jgi:hypothetical protein
MHRRELRQPDIQPGSSGFSDSFRESRFESAMNRAEQ